MAPKRILLVDDEPNVVKSCAKMLELEGFSVKGVTSGMEAIDSYHHDHFDLVLTDLKMPDTDGLEVLTAVRKHDPTAAVVIFTAYGTKESVVEALRLGAREFLEKPLDTKTLVATVRQILAQENGTAVRGNLHTMSLPSIFQVNCTERNNARLSLKHGRYRGDIFFADGDVVHAATGSEVGEEAVYRLLSWKDADFELEMDILAPERTIDTGWSGLLLEGMRRLDEEAAGVDELDGSDSPAADKVAGTEKGVMSDMLQELAKALRMVENVIGVVIASRDGVVLADELEKGDPEREGAVAVFVGNAAGVVGDPLALGTFQWGIANVGKETVLVLGQQEYHVGLILGDRASPAMVATSAQAILKNGV